MTRKLEADMHTASGQTQDLSMEEILASIRRIVTEDQPTDVNAAVSDNVYDLTQLVSEDGNETDVRLVQSVAPNDLRTVQPSAPRPVSNVADARASIAPINNTHGLMSDKISDTIAQQFVKLNLAQHGHQVEELVNELRQETTLESLVRDMVKPFIMSWLENNYEPLVVKMLKKWLERNLPELVERIVNEEIRKLTHPAGE
jgi:cell pole-organizing protein PopZ